MGPDMDAKRRVLHGLGGKAKEWKADALRKKYAPPDDVDAAVNEATPPDGQGALDSLEAQGEANAELADETVSENRRILEGLDEAQLAELVAALKAK